MDRWGGREGGKGVGGREGGKEGRGRGEITMRGRREWHKAFCVAIMSCTDGTHNEPGALADDR